MKIRLLIVTGYLGSGKTTLLRQFKRAVGEAACHFIVNEAGEVALDQAAYELAEEAAVVAGGCACCVKKQELVNVLKDVVDNGVAEVDREDAYIVVETSGLANPAPIIFSITTDDYLRHHVTVAGVVCAIGCVEASDALARYPSATQQLVMADAIVLTKTDRADARQAENARALVASRSGNCPIYSSGTQTLDWQAVLTGLTLRLDRVATSTVQGPTSDMGDNGHSDISNCVLRINEALDWTVFGVWLSALLSRHGESIMRVKGVIPVIDWQGVRFHVAINGVQHVMYPPQHVADSRTLPDRPALVFFFRNLSSVAIERSLRSFYEQHGDIRDLPVRSGLRFEYQPSRRADDPSRVRGAALNADANAVYFPHSRPALIYRLPFDDVR